MADTPSTTNPPILLTDTKIAGLKAPATGRVEHRDLKTPGLRLRIGATSKKTWIVRARIGSTVLNRKLGTYPAMSLATARTSAEALLASLAREGSREGIDRTFGEAAEAWVDKVARPNNVTWKNQKRRLEMHVLPHWQDKRLSDIRRRDVRDLIEGLEGEHLPNQTLGTIKTVFKFALARDWVEASPAEGIEKPKPDNSRDRVLSMEEIARVWRASDFLGFPFSQYMKTLMLTAQRRTEVASMRWDALDLEAGTWTLEADDTKSSRKHLVPLPLPVQKLLQSLPRFGPYVFTTDGTTHVSGYAKQKSKLDAFIAADSDEPFKPWTLHDLRRTAATHMVRLGILEAVVGKVLNHAPTGVTAKVYALHQYEPEKRSALGRWSAEVERTITGRVEDKIVSLRPVR